MTESTISAESFEIALTSEMGPSSARKMKAAYLENAGNGSDEGIPSSFSRDAHQGPEVHGPNARVYLTKITIGTPAAEIKKILHGDPDQDEKMRNCAFYTLLFALSVRMDDPSTTRFINATMTWEVPRDTKIPDFSPRGKEIVTEIIASGAAGISVTSALDLRAAESPEPGTRPESPISSFEVRGGPGEQFFGSYAKKTGFKLHIPAEWLLEYQGMRKNEQAVYWELYPPMTPRDVELSGKENLAVFSLILQAPPHQRPDIVVRVEGRVKGNLLGVIHLTGSAIIPV